MKRFGLLMLLFFVSVVSYGQAADGSSSELPQDPALERLLSRTQAPSTLTTTQEYSSENITIRKFDEKKWQEIVGSRNYSDKRTLETPQSEKQSGEEPTANSGARTTDNNESGDRYSYDEDSETLDMSWLGPVGQIIFYVALASIIIIILVQVVRTTSFKSNPKRTRTTEGDSDDIHDITTLDTEELISKAHRARDYKLAIRLYFLDLLKKLNESGRIVWTKDKTNRDYLSELFTKQYYFEEIRKLTIEYERVWYGEHFPNEDRYQELRREFQEINQKFKTS